jgi:hypothetical protein
MTHSGTPWKRPPAPSLVVLSLGLLNIALGLNARWQTGDFGDFSAFHESAQNLWVGGPLYARANLNSPIAVLAMGPLGLAGEAPAWVVWQLLNVAAFVWTVRVALLVTAQRATPWLVALLALHASTAAQTSLGQIAWVLGLPLAYGWLAWRTRRPASAGAWLGVVVAVKPFVLPALVLAALSRHAGRLALWGMATAGGLTMVGIVALGLEPSRDYLSLSPLAWGSVGGFPLGSLSGMLHRWGLSPASSLMLAGILFVPVAWRWRELDGDRQWLAALTTALLFNPLGWVYYQAWLLPPILAIWGGTDRRLLGAGIALGCLPPVVAAAVPALQPLYLASLLLIWAASLTPAPASSQPSEPPAAMSRDPSVS